MTNETSRPSQPSPQSKYPKLEWLLILVSGLMGFLIVWRGAGCDGDFPGHVSSGIDYLLHGRVPAGWPPFPVMAIIHGFLAILAGYPKISSFPILNVFSFLCGALSILFFYKIIQHYNRDGLTISVTATLALMATHPVFIVACGTWGDYVVSLAFLLAAWLCLLEGEFAGGAVLSGLAMGVRISNCVWMLPFTILVYRQHGFSRAIRYLLAAVCVGALVDLPSFTQIGFNFGRNLGGRGSEAQSLLNSSKTAISKIVGFIGLPTLLVTLVACRQNAYLKSLRAIKSFWELPAVLVAEYATFVYLPSDPGYIISTLPVLALLLPRPDRRAWVFLQVAVVFAMNFIVFDFQNKIPTKLHLSHGYYVAEFTCHDSKTALEHFRFSLPRGPYYPIGDWAEDARPKGSP